MNTPRVQRVWLRLACFAVVLAGGSWGQEPTQLYLEHGPPFVEANAGGASLVTPSFFGNQAYGAASGSYSRCTPAFHVTDSSTDTTTVQPLVGCTPRNQFNARWSLNLPRRFEVDQAGYFGGRLANGPVPAYVRCDVRCGWRAGKSWDRSVAGQNPLDAQHLEYLGTGDVAMPMPVRRGVHAGLIRRL